MGLFVSVLGALWAKVQLGSPLHIPPLILLGNMPLFLSQPLHPQMSLWKRQCCNGLWLHCNFIESLPSLFHSNREVFPEHLMRYKPLSMTVCTCRGKDRFYAIGPQRGRRAYRRGMGSYLEGDALGLFIKMVSFHFLCMSSDVRFNAYLLLMVSYEGYIALDKPEIWLILEPRTG